MPDRQREHRRRLFRRRAAPGTAPGTLHVDPEAPPPVLRAVLYGPDRIEERALSSPDEIEGLRGEWPVVWVNVNGLGDPAVLTAIGESFGLHRLALEDVVNLHQRAKVDEYEDHLYVVARMPSPDPDGETEQVSLFLGDGWLLTFQERPGDCFGPVLERLRGGKGRIRSLGADYLAYALLDAIVDHYFPVLEAVGDRLDAIDEEVLASPTGDTLTRIRRTRNTLTGLRRVLWPFRDMLTRLLRDAGDRIGAETRIYLRDCQDHVVSLLDLLESQRETVGGLQEGYLSQVSNRMNEIMKVLTIIATIFIPLTFLAGIYGMNFQYMPELSWPWGYPAVLGVMAVIAGGLLVFFRRKRWL